MGQTQNMGTGGGNLPYYRLVQVPGQAMFYPHQTGPTITVGCLMHAACNSMLTLVPQH